MPCEPNTIAQAVADDQLFQPRALEAFAENEQACVDCAPGLDQQVKALDGDQAAHRDDAFAARRVMPGFVRRRGMAAGKCNTVIDDADRRMREVHGGYLADGNDTLEWVKHADVLLTAVQGCHAADLKQGKQPANHAGRLVAMGVDDIWTGASYRAPEPEQRNRASTAARESKGHECDALCETRAVHRVRDDADVDAVLVAHQPVCQFDHVLFKAAFTVPGHNNGDVQFICDPGDTAGR